MRAIIVIDDEFMAEAMRATGLRTKREAVEFFGEGNWQGDLDADRRDHDDPRHPPAAGRPLLAVGRTKRSADPTLRLHDRRPATLRMSESTWQMRNTSRFCDKGSRCGTHGGVSMKRSRPT